MKGKRHKPILPSKIEALKFLERLQLSRPEIFPPKPLPKVPLAIGIFEQLNAHRDELRISKNVLEKALRLWCKGVRYYTALTKVGSPRYDINGNITGTVTEKDAEYANKKLKIIFSANSGRRIEDLKLSSRSYNLLKLAGFNFEHEIKLKFEQLAGIKGIGKKSLEEINAAIKN